MVRFGAAVLALIIGVSPAWAHPLHTSLARVTVDTRTGTINVSVRVFADDLAQASRTAGENTAGYVASHFIIHNGNGTRLTLVACGEKHVGDLVWVCLQGKTAAKSKAITLRSSVFFERYADQINVVSFIAEAGTSNILFSRGDKPMRIEY